MRGRMSGAYITSEHYVDAMIHFVHQWRKWLILSQKSAESISGLVVKTSELISETFLERTAVRSKTSELISVFRAQRAKHQSVCQEDAAILASCRNYFLKRPTNRDIFELFIAAFLFSSSRSRLLQKGKPKGLEFINGTVTNHCLFCRSPRSFSNTHLRIFILGSDLFHIDGIPLRPNESPRTAGNSRSLSFVQI